jgi:hypothetical protein
MPQFPNWRAAAALLHAQHPADRARARTMLDEVMAQGVEGIPVDVGRSAVLPLVAESIALLEEPCWAGELYEALVPYEGQILVVATPSHAHGAADRFCGMLTPLAGGNLERARAHFDRALDVEHRFRAPALSSRTLYWYGRTLGRHGTADDDWLDAIELLDEARRSVPPPMVDLRRDIERELDRVRRTRMRRAH